MNAADEIERLSTPDPVPSLWQYMFDKHAWIYVVVPTAIALWAVSFAWPMSWWSAILFAVLFGAVGWFVGRALSLWQTAVTKARRREEWVKTLSTGGKPFPRDIAWIIFHLIEDDRLSVAAAIALEFLDAEEKRP